MCGKMQRLWAYLGFRTFFPTFGDFERISPVPNKKIFFLQISVDAGRLPCSELYLYVPEHLVFLYNLKKS